MDKSEKKCEGRLPRDPQGDEEWFGRWFNECYLTVYQHRTEAEAVSFVELIPIWDMLPRDSLCLDIGAGEGRFSRALAANECRVIGLDLSPTLLKEAVRKTSDSKILFVRGDMRKLPFAGKFSLIICMFTSFGYFSSDAEHLQLLMDCANLTVPGGCLILDLPNPVYTRRYVADNPTTIRMIDKMEVTEERHIISSSHRVTKRIIIQHNGIREEYFESVRLFEPDELTRLLGTAGYGQLLPFWGDYKGSPLGDENPRMIYFGVRHSGTD